MEERNLLVEEIDAMYLQLREDFRINEKLTTDQQKIIENLEEELTLTKEERDFL